MCVYNGSPLLLYYSSSDTCAYLSNACIERSLLPVCCIERSLLRVEWSLLPLNIERTYLPLCPGPCCLYFRSRLTFLYISVQPSGRFNMLQLRGKDLSLPVTSPTEQIHSPATAPFTPVPPATSPLQPRTVPNLFTPPPLPSPPEIPVPIAQRTRPPARWLWSPPPPVAN